MSNSSFNLKIATLFCLYTFIVFFTGGKVKEAEPSKVYISGKFICSVYDSQGFVRDDKASVDCGSDGLPYVGNVSYNEFSNVVFTSIKGAIVFCPPKHKLEYGVTVAQVDKQTYECKKIQ
jgi:hypothetical protein